jgi:CRISPR-associated endonuclease Cas2
MSVKKRHIRAHEVIKLLKTGSLARVAPKPAGAIEFLGVLGKNAEAWEFFFPSSVTKQLTNLVKVGAVEIMEVGEETVATVANTGRAALAKYDLTDLSIPRQKPWDKRWRMVFFDIGDSPETERVRFKLRYTLKKLGFVMFQKSVYLYPYPCRQEIMRVKELLKVPGSVRFAEVSELDDDGEMRRRFRL